MNQKRTSSGVVPTSGGEAWDPKEFDDLRRTEETAELLKRARTYFEQEELRAFLGWVYDQDHPRFQCLRNWMNGVFTRAGVPMTVVIGCRHGEHYILLMQNINNLNEEDRHHLRHPWRTAVSKLA